MRLASALYLVALRYTKCDKECEIVGKVIVFSATRMQQIAYSACSFSYHYPAAKTWSRVWGTGSAR